MNPRLIAVKTHDRDKRDGALRTHEFVRILALVRPFWKLLTAGLLATVAFASLHTVSISAAFPVFKILLEEEGLTGWIDRTVAGSRVGLEFAPLSDRDALALEITEVISPQGLCGDPECTVDRLWGVDGKPAAQLLHDLAREETKLQYPVKVTCVCGDLRQEPRMARIDLSAPEWNARLLRRAGSLIPTGADANKLDSLKYILVGLLITVVLANIFRYLGEVLISKAILRAMMNLRAQLYDRSLRLPMSFFAGKPTADLVTRFVQDVQEIQRGLLTLFGKFIREPLRAVFIFGLAFALDWRITLTMVVVAPIAVVIFLAVGRSVKRANRKLLEAYGMMIGALTASLQSIRVVKAYTAEDHERERLWQVDLGMFDHQLKLARLRAFVSPMMETLAIIAGGLVTVWLASRVLNQDLSLSKFAALGVALSVLFDPLRKLTDVYVRVQRATAGAERIFQVLDEPIEGDMGHRDVGHRDVGHRDVGHRFSTGGQHGLRTDAPPVELKPLAKNLEYDNVTFTYPGAQEPAVKNVSISINQGETVAIVGPNGCGKTTLISMLPRLFDPDSGQIRYDGVDLCHADLKSLRTQIGLVSQEAIIFAGTPVENIAYGVPSASESDAVDAAKRAYADEFIRNIPGGYSANLGERGTTLSGGQRQRLSIARAIFRNAPILIFDEATSQIDTESELKIQTALKEFAKGRTTLIIAHRLSTIQFAGRIIVMDRGRVIDTGTHEELFEGCPLYRSLCETQFITEAGRG